MITIYSQNYINNKTNGGSVSVDLRGLSTDQKPTELNDSPIGNGSTFIEIDTGKFYMYDLENELWKEI